MRILISTLLFLCAAAVAAAQTYVINTVAGSTVIPTGPATGWSLATPRQVATDSSGNVYVVGQGIHQIWKLNANGDVVRVIGNGMALFAGEGGQGVNASMDSPTGVAVDSSGNIYLADSYNARIRKVSVATGIITTIAGTGTSGFSGDGGLATQARFNFPSGIAIDSSGNIYVADRSNQRIRRFTEGGVITTIAGSGTRGFSGDGGLATSASFNNPLDVAVDNSGTVYVADLTNGRVRKFTVGGNISTLVSNVVGLWAVAVDSSSNVYFSYSGSRIAKIAASTGVLSVVAGNGSAGFSGDGSLATSAQLSEAQGLAVDGSGNLYFSDNQNHRLRKVTAATGIVNTVAGNGERAFRGDGGPATQAQLGQTFGVSLDSQGNFYLGDQYNHRIRKVSVSSGIISTVAGNGTPGTGGDGGPATSAQLSFPRSPVVDKAGNMYFAQDATIRKVDSAGIITTVAGTGQPGFSGDGGPATSAQVSYPNGLALDSGGNLYLTERINHRVRKINAATGIITAIAGTGVAGSGGDGGPATSATLNYPEAVAVDSHDNVYVSEGLRIRKIDAVTGIITGFADVSTAGLVVDSADNVYAATFDKIYKISGSTRAVTVIAGNGMLAHSGDSGPATSASITFNLFHSSGVMGVDTNGVVYYADILSNRIRTLSPVIEPLLVALKAHTGQFVPGTSAGNSFTISAKNTGPGATTAAVTLTDVVPASFPVGTMPPGCNKVGQTVTCTAASIAAGATASFEIPVSVASSASGPISNTVTISGGGGRITTPTATDVVTVVAPASSMTANTGTTPQSATVSTAFASALAVTVRDAGNSPVSGINVTFTAPASGASGTFSNGTAAITVATNASGVASAPFTANATVGGPYNVTAAVASLTTVTFVLTNTAGPAVSMTANTGTTPQSAAISTAFTNALAVTVRDAGSNPVSGVSVTFTAPGSGASGTFSNGTATITVATNATGVASAPFTANATAGGPYNVAAAATGLTTVNFALTNTAGAVSSMTANTGTTPQSAAINTAFASALAVTVRDGGSNPVSGVNVTFTAPASGASGTFSNGTATITVATNASGVASAPLTANATAGSLYNVAAAATGLTTVNFTLTNTAGAASSMTANAGTTPQSATVSMAFANALAVSVRDAGSNPVSGVNVTFTAPGSGASGTFSNGTATITVPTNASGVASAPFTANATTGGPYNVTAAAASLTSVNFALTNTAPVLQSIAVTPANPTIGKGQTRQFIATGTYNNSSTQDITESVTWTSGTPATATITAGGLATGVAVGTSTISARSDSVSGTTVLTVTAAILQSIAVTPANPSITKGATQQFTATGTYSDSTAQNITTSVTWASATLSTATISTSGLAIGAGAGSSTISATLGEISGSTVLTVTAAVLQSIAITPVNPTITKSVTQQFTATGTYSDSTTQNITASVTWVSDTPEVATITASGLATGVETGSSRITATLGGVSHSTTMTVVAATLQSIAITPVNPSIAKGGTQQFTATGTYTDSTTRDLTTSVSWTSATAATATISASGLASGVAAGTTTITARFILSAVSGSTTLTVTAPTLQSIAVTPANPSITKGATQQFTATGTYSDSSTQNLTGSVTWASSTPGTATITGTGLAAGVAAGSSTISATVGAVSGSTMLTVTAATLQSIAVTPANPSITKGGTQQFTAIGTYSDSTTENITTSVTWTSGTLSTATITGTGLATGVAAGTSMISATVGAVSGSTTLTVTAPTLQSIVVTPSNATITKGGTQQFTAIGTYSDSTTQNITSSVTWTSSMPATATITGTGFATGVAAGTSMISATAGAVSGSTTLTVTAPTLQSIVVTPSNATITKGGTQQFTAIGTYSDSTTQNITSSVTWTSSMPATATITGTGLATGVAAGTSMISATVGAVSGSTTLTVTTAVATVTLNHLTQTYTGSPLTPTATTNPPGLAITWSGTPQTAAGSYSMTATVNDPSYTGSATGTFVIAKAASSVTISGGGSFPYNRLPHPASAAVTGAGGLSQPLTVGYSGSCNAAPVTVAEGSSCAVAASYPGDDNHLPGNSSASISIIRAAASVTPGNGSKFFGTPDPAPLTTGILSGFIAGDTVTASYGRAAGEVVGAYPIGAVLSPSSVLANYNVAYNTGTFTIFRDTTTLTYTGPTASTYGQCSSVNLSAVLMDAVHGLPVSGTTITFTLGTQTFTAVTNAAGTASVVAVLAQNAGNTTVSASYAGSTTLAPSSSGSTPFTISASSNVGPIPAASIYTGPMLAWTSSPTSNSATVTLSATIKELAACSGDIRTAKVTFAVRNGSSYTAIPGAQNLSVGLVSPADTTVGTASAIVNLSTGNGSYSQFNIAVILGGNYTLNDPSTDTLITVAQPGQANSMIGDGKINLTTAPASAGFLGTSIPAGAAGYMDVAAAVSFNKNLTNLQGSVQLLIKSRNKPDGAVDSVTHTYLIKSTSIAGLTSPAPGVLTFTGKCVVQDVTNPSSPVSIDGGATLQLTTANAGTAQGGAIGTVNVEVQPKSGGLWIAAGWNGTQPLPKPLVSGSIAGQ